MDEQDIQISRVYKCDGETKLKAFVDVAFGDVMVKGVRIVEGSKGLFVGMPRHQGKDGKWYDTVYPTTKELQKHLSDLVLAAYNQ
jgi:stage V sporulation protein G